MKRILLSFFVLFTTVTGFSQTSYPCVTSYTADNLGGGNCPTAGTGSSKHYPGYLNQLEDNNYFPTGKIVVYFATPIPPGTEAPQIIKAGVDDPANPGQILGAPFDYKYAAFNDNTTIPRASVVYCYYGSASNQNIFNGSKAPLLAFELSYIGNTSSQSCGEVTNNPPVESPLPVSFKAFTATKGNTSTSLKWTTAFESNNKGFYVQRFYNGQWTTLQFIATKAENGTSGSELNYTYTDVFNSKGVTQYRIMQVDIDGRAKYSEIRSISNGSQASSVLVYPNPATVNGNVSIVLANAGSLYDIQVVDAAGRIVKEYNSVRSTQQVSGLSKGQYLARVIERESGQVSVEKFIMQ